MKTFIQTIKLLNHKRLKRRREKQHQETKPTHQETKPTIISLSENQSWSEHFNPYIKSVLRALRDHDYFLRFRAEPAFMQIYEGVDQDSCEHYIQWLQDNQPEFLQDIKKFKVNDLIGKPHLHQLPQIGAISGITLRYVAFAAHIHQLFGNLDAKTVAEIGVGYGGLLLVLDQVNAMRAYHLFDLHPVLQLTSRYLEYHLLRSSYHLSTLNQCDGQQNYDLVISNFALSELPGPLKKMYIKKILSKAAAGYITTNDDGATIQLLQKDMPRDDYTVFSPIAKYDRGLEKIVVWGHKERP